MTDEAPRIFTPEYYARMRDLEERSWWNAGMRDAAAGLLHLAALGAGGRMLDVGCGSGQTMTWFARLYPGWRTIGLDVAERGLAVARTMGLDVVRASAMDVPLASRSLDLAVSLDVLQHLPIDGGDRRALAEIVRVLKPGGYLLLRTNAQSLVKVPDDPEFQFHKYSPRELGARITGAGLQIVRLGRLNAVLGLAEIGRDVDARTAEGSYRGLPPAPHAESWRWPAAVKRAWLRCEGRAVQRGWSWPFGRTMLALCRRSPDARS